MKRAPLGLALAACLLLAFGGAALAQSPPKAAEPTANPQMIESIVVQGSVRRVADDPAGIGKADRALDARSSVPPLALSRGGQRAVAADRMKLIPLDAAQAACARDPLR